MLIVGDTHGRLEAIEKACIRCPKDDTVLSIGDVGVGFKSTMDLKFPDNFRFIRGNHDNPAVAKAHPQYLGDCGVIDNVYNNRIAGRDHEVMTVKAFYVSGAYSVDQKWRTENVDWWRDEQLSMVEMQKALEMYSFARPDVVFTHDAPHMLSAALLEACCITRPDNRNFGGPTPNNTNLLFDAMFKAWKPKVWLFGHWHTSWAFRHFNYGTYFRCIDVNEIVDLNKIIDDCYV